MKIFLIILIGLIGAYLLSVGVFNDWNFLTGLEPTEVIKRMLLFTWLSAEFAVIAFAISELFFDMD